jgi:hypothetical protein
VSLWFNSQNQTGDSYLFSSQTLLPVLPSNPIFINIATGFPRCNLGKSAPSSVSLSFDNNWHNITCAHDAVNGDTIYLDGKNVGTNSTDTYVPTTLGAFYVGNKFGSMVFQGLINNLQIFSGSLTASEVGKLYAEGLKTHQMAANVK